jgi:hypothetical protein
MLGLVLYNAKRKIMKKIKKSLLLLICLLFISQQQTYCAWSWWQNIVQAPLQAITKSIDKETLKKLFPFALLATVIGFAYWMSQKGKSTDETIVNEIVENTSLKQAAYKLEQYPVYGQSNRDGGGGASCGYHTLLRSMQLVQLKNDNASEDTIQNALMDTSVIEAYFGNPESDWRAKIIAERKKKALKNELYKEFKKVLKEDKEVVSERDKEKKAKVMGLYNSVLGSLKDMIAGLADNIVDENNPYEFTKTDIKDFIRQALKKLKNSSNEEQINELEQSSIMQEYLSISGIQQAAGAESGILRSSDLLKKINSMPDPERRFQGDWLDDGEVELLWNYEKEKRMGSMIPRNIMCDMKTIANFDFIGNENVDETTTYIKGRPAKPAEPGKAEEPESIGKIETWKNKKEAFQIFALGTMRQTGEQTGTAGHWYPLVMHQDAQGNRKYYIMDSMSKDRTHDKNALKVIDLIEQNMALQ